MNELAPYEELVAELERCRAGEARLQERLRQAEASLRAQRLEVAGTMTRGIAHDLNNILTPLVVAAPMVRRHVTDPEARELLGTIEASAERAAGVLRRLLALGESREPERSAVDLDELFRDVVASLRLTFPESIRVRARVRPSTPNASGDPVQLHELLLHLCANAMDAMPAGGALDLEADAARTGSPDVGFVWLSVTDTGAGIPPDDLPKIFDPFFTTRDVGVGKGLGLSTAQSIVRRHGGTLTVESQVGRGSRFEVRLPAVARLAAESAPTGNPSSASDEKSVAPVARTAILVIEDDEGVRDVVEALLLREHDAVFATASAATGLTIVADPLNRVGVVLTDLVLPGVQGSELLRQIRATAPRVVVVVMSGSSGAAHENSLRELGVAHFLPKPFNGGQLSRVIAAALRA